MNALPDSMQAVAIHNAALTLTRKPLPVAGPDEVLIRVTAAGVNRPDILQRQGLYPPPAGTVPDIPGLEVAGEIVKPAGPWQKGDRVCALLTGGGYAAYCAAPATQCLPVPHGVDDVAAAALPETFFTVWKNLVHHARLQRGETVLIHGGASGIGTAAIQIARTLGASVFVTAGSDAKCAACTALGATAAINYKTADFVADILDHTGNRGVDVVLDMVGGDYVDKNIRCLAENGRHVSIAVQGGRRADIDIFQVMRRQIVLTGSTLRARGTAEKARIAAELKSHIWPLLARGDIRPVIDSTFPLAQAQAAHDRLESGQHIGKVVLTLAESA